MIEVSKFVYSTKDDMNDGCGVLAGNLFITAGHLVEEQPFYLYIDGHPITLKKEDAICFENNVKEDGHDLAVFRLQDYHSHVQLLSDVPMLGDVLEIVSIEHVVKSEGDINDVFSYHAKERYEDRICHATVEEISGNFFKCRTSMILKKGSSGSPVFKDGYVCGILHGGWPGTPFCVFQSSLSIIKKIEQYY